ncbi:MAG: methylthioribulose 1-phosphate dehydratase [Pseudoxanthomonas sp.]|nr:methylthioribulose 1-phosphate dehydratase [Pseudoxanthomonas sp.]
MPSFDPARLDAAADTLAAAGRWLSGRGWTPATSSNFSLRLDAGHAAITVSGRDKGALGRDDFMAVDFDGHAVGSARRSSAETLLHTHLYRRDPAIGCVLHTHSKVQTVASRLFADQGGVRLAGYEMLKALAGNASHELAIDLPVFANTQHMPDLVERVEAWLDGGGPAWGYLIEGHGLYAWGADCAEAMRHVEAFEFLLDCELDLRRLRT